MRIYWSSLLSWGHARKAGCEKNQEIHFVVIGFLGPLLVLSLGHTRESKTKSHKLIRVAHWSVIPHCRTKPWSWFNCFHHESYCFIIMYNNSPSFMHRLSHSVSPTSELPTTVFFYRFPSGQQISVGTYQNFLYLGNSLHFSTLSMTSSCQWSRRLHCKFLLRSLNSVLLTRPLHLLTLTTLNVSSSSSWFSPLSQNRVSFSRFETHLPLFTFCEPVK